ADARPDGLLPAGRGPGRPGRRLRESGVRDLAVLRLDHREADRQGRRARGRDRQRRARTPRDRCRRRADHTRPRPRRARERGVPLRRVLDVHARDAAGGAACVSISRRQARRQALFLLYQWDLSGQEIGSQYGEEIDAWARGVAETVAGRAAKLDARITAAAEGWTADRLGAVERSALRVAVHELETGDVPAQ